MRQDDWPRELVKVVAESVRDYRTRFGLSAQKLADACPESAGLTRSVITNLETGVRESLSVPEWLALARGLQVPPLLLLFPLGRRSQMEVLPGVEVDPGTALGWANHGRLGDIESEDGLVIGEFRRHEEFVSMWEQSRREARRIRELLTKSAEELTESGEDASDLRVELADRERLQDRAAVMLGQVRRTLRRLDRKVPELPRALRFVDEEPS